jgi:quercetin dioxygenase-like cupin family protein
MKPAQPHSRFTLTRNTACKSTTLGANREIVMKLTRFAILAALLVGAFAGVVLDRTLFAQQSGITRTVLQRVDDPGAKTHEAVMAVVDFQPGGSPGRHMHPGVEIGYVLDGAIVVEQQGRQPVAKKAGEYFQIDANAAHDAKNTATTPAKILAIYLVEKGKPLAEPVK